MSLFESVKSFYSKHAAALSPIKVIGWIALLFFAGVVVVRLLFPVILLTAAVAGVFYSWQKIQDQFKSKQPK